MPPFLNSEWEGGDKKPVLPPYKFSEALVLSVVERFERAVAVLQEQEKQKSALLGEALIRFSPGFAEDKIAEWHPSDVDAEDCKLLTVRRTLY